jgi:hypothetical protein
VGTGRKSKRETGDKKKKGRHGRGIEDRKNKRKRGPSCNTTTQKSTKQPRLVSDDIGGETSSKREEGKPDSHLSF